MSARCRDVALRARDGRVRGANRVRRIDTDRSTDGLEISGRSRRKKQTTKKTTALSCDLFAKISRYRARAYGRAVSKNRRGKKSGVEGEKHPQIAETIDERARDAPVYVARTATARARLRRETREGARKPAGRVVGWIFGKSRVSEAERRGGERNDAA
jgi:hypothetical protein